MRRLLSAFAAWGVLFAVTGCHHTAGVCDCDPGTNLCLYPQASSVARPYPAPAAAAAPAAMEPIKVMPKVEGK